MPDSTTHALPSGGRHSAWLFLPAPALAGVAALLAWTTALTEPPAAGLLLATAWMSAAALAASIATMVPLYRQASERAVAMQSLHISQAREKVVLDSAMDAILSIDHEQRIVLYNAAAEQLFNWPRAEVLGQPLDKLIPARFRAAHAAHIARFGQTGVTSRRMGDQTVLTGLRADGSEFPIEAAISQHSEQGKQVFTVILRDVTERVNAVNALTHSRAQLRQFAGAAASVREQEKSRIARELHDELAQALTALKMDLSWAQERLPAAATALAAKLDTMQTMLGDTVAATRRIAADLRPLMLDDLGLLPAVEWLLNNFRARTGITCEFDLATPELELTEPHATAIFRILQESLTNVARHARATLVEVSLGRDDDAVLLTVQDNGCGFEVSGQRDPASFGLMGLRERVYLLDGELTLESRPGSGTRIGVRVPLTAPDAASQAGSFAAAPNPAPPPGDRA